ncbi:hypothetical protein Tco_1221485 [Tanacetum coccineum]
MVGWLGAMLIRLSDHYYHSQIDKEHVGVARLGFVAIYFIFVRSLFCVETASQEAHDDVITNPDGVTIYEYKSNHKNSIRSILENEKLNGRNFLDWYSNLIIVLKYEQKLNHLEEALREAPPATVIAVICNAYTRRVEQELFETVKAFHACKQEEGQSISTYVLKMKGYFDQMELLGYLMTLVLGVNSILTSLSKDYDQFIQNYNMHSMRKTILEQHVMLKLAKKGTHMCNTIQGLKGSQKLNKGALDLYVGDGNCAAVKAIWSFDLSLPSGMVLVLDN